MSHICLSECGQFVELWNNGSKIRWQSLSLLPIHLAVNELARYSTEWAGDRHPTISADVQAKLDAVDRTMIRMAFGKE